MIKDWNWWHEAKGTLTTSANNFEDIVDEASDSGRYVIVDFFIPGCHYCEKFYKSWNQIVDEFTDEYGEEHIQFIKVNGEVDGRTP